MSGFVVSQRPPLPGSAKPYFDLEDVGEAVDGRLRGGRLGRDVRGLADVRAGIRRVLLLKLGREREEQLVLDDRAAEPEPFLRLAERRRAEVGDVALHLLVARAVRARAVEFVRAALRDGVDEEAGEVALANVERRQEDLVFLDRLERNLLRAGGTAGLQRRAQTEEVVRDRAVDLNRVEAIVLTAAGKTRALRRHLRREARRNR